MSQKNHEVWLCYQLSHDDFFFETASYIAAEKSYVDVAGELISSIHKENGIVNLVKNYYSYEQYIIHGRLEFSTMGMVEN